MICRFLTGAQFGTVISMPLSGLLAASDLKWPSIFYVFGAIGAVWSVAFLIICHEDPEKHPRIDAEEKKYILSSLWGSAGVSVRIFYFGIHNLTTFSTKSFSEPSHSVEIHHNVSSLLGYSYSAYGSQLWL